MTWRAPERSEAVAAVYAAAEADRAASPDDDRLEVDHVVERAGGADAIDVTPKAEAAKKDA